MDFLWLNGKCWGGFWDSKGTVVPLAGGLEDSVLQGLKMRQKTQEGSKKQSGELFFAGESTSVFPANFLFFQIHFFVSTIVKEPQKNEPP